MRPAGLRSLRHLASPLPTSLTRRTLPTRIPKSHSRALQTSRRHRQQDDVIIVRKPRFTRRKFALVLAHGLCIYACWNFLIWKLAVVLDDVEDVEPEEGEDVSLFIPLSFPKVLPQEFYKSTDAEWQEFVKFSKDAKRKKSVRGKALQSKVIPNCRQHTDFCRRGTGKACPLRHRKTSKNTGIVRQSYTLDQTLVRDQVSRWPSPRVCAAWA